jgi:transglutaminase-like putative cysteine protease
MFTRRSFVAAACAALLSGCLAAPSAATRDRDLWYSVGDGAQAYGHVNVRVRGLEDGASEHVSAMLLQIEFFGARQEVRTSSTAVIEPDLTLRSLVSECEQMSGRAVVRARATEDGLVLEREQAGTTHTSTFAPADGLPVLSDLVLGDWLQRLVASGAESGLTRRVHLLNTDVGEPVVATLRLLERDARGSTWTLELEQDWQTTTLRLDGEGVLIEQASPTPPVFVTRTTREQALAINYRAMPERELLTFPLERELPPTRRLESLDVELTWQDIPPAEFVLEDARQRLISLTEDAGRYRAVVRLTRPVVNGTDAVRPLPRASFEATLASDEYILPDNARIAAHAAEIAGAVTSARAAATALCRWVSEHIQPAMIAETLSGPQVLERRTGKCTEYTTLFASLARAAGIPTRIVLGQRRTPGPKGDMWGGHMWTEVFVGEWIPVDASVNEVGGSLDLLKLIHSDTVKGTQPLRWKLTRSLDVSIAGVKERPTDDAVRNGLDGTTYTNAEHGFRFELPAATWVIEETPSADALVLRLRPPDPALGDAAMFHVTTFELPQGVAPKLILDARLEQHRKSLGALEVLRDERIEAESITGHRTTFGGVPKNGKGVPLRVSEVLLHHGEAAVLINLIATVELHETHAATFERVVASVAFTE